MIKHHPTPRVATSLLVLAASAGLAALSAWIYTPWLASIRVVALPVAAMLALAMVVCTPLLLRRWRSPAGAAIAAAAIAGPTMLAIAAWRGHDHQAIVAAAPAARLGAVGRHVISGYRAPSDLQDLIRRGAIGGVFVTARNARDKTRAQLAAEIAAFQTLAADQGRPPLIITTDQEGGFVSRLSPPLERPKLLAALIKQGTSEADRLRIARAEGASVGAALAAVGVNLNLAPLADLDFGIRNPADRMSRIGERAISGDPEVVATIAKAYCDGMASAGVGCTLKHFPGLGRVADDTHVTSAHLTATRDDLLAKDWVPYRRENRSDAAAVMIGHVVATAIDARAPASLSRPVIADVLRGTLGHTGLVITDDLCMAAISDRPDGIAVGAADTLRAGGDLVLVSYDPLQVYAAIAGLLRNVKDAELVESRSRLDAFLERFGRR